MQKDYWRRSQFGHYTWHPRSRFWWFRQWIMVIWISLRWSVVVSLYFLWATIFSIAYCILYVSFWYFSGSPSCFLFKLKPHLEIYQPTGYNSNFMYFNHGQDTFPNGLVGICTDLHLYLFGFYSILQTLCCLLFLPLHIIVPCFLGYGRSAEILWILLGWAIFLWAFEGWAPLHNVPKPTALCWS